MPGRRYALFTPYLFLLPNILIFTVFVVIPALMGLFFSFTDYNGLKIQHFIGLANYAYILQDPVVQQAFLRTTLYAILVIPLLYIVSLSIARLLANDLPYISFFRALFFLPTLVSFIVVGISWKWLFGDSFGIINYFLEQLGFPAISWLSDGRLAFFVIILATIWSRTGFFMLIFLAALKSLPNTLYEAAMIDGANRRQRFFYITLPLLKPISLLVIILSMIESYKAFPLMYALTGGGPGRDTTMIVQTIYEIGMVKYKLGYASAISFVLFIIIALLTWAQFRWSKGGAYE